MLVIERYHTIGGMTISEEITLPGFLSDVHASGYQLANLSPAPRELELETYGLELIEPDLVYAHAFPDGRAVVVSRDLDATVASVARHSARDAETWRRLVGQYRAQKEGLVTSLFSPPPSFAAEAAVQERTSGGMEAYRFSLQSLRSWSNEILRRRRSNASSAPSPPLSARLPTTPAAHRSPGSLPWCCMIPATTS